MDDEEEDEGENLLDYSVTVDEIKTVITKDFTNAKNENTIGVEATKTYMSNLVNKCDFLNICRVQKAQVDGAEENEELDDEDDDVNSLSSDSSVNKKINPRGIHNVLRRSLTAFKEKAKVDMKVVHLLDQEDIKETTLGMHDLIRGSFGNKMKRNHKQTKKQIESNKVTFEGTVKQIADANSINNLSNVDNVVGSLIKEFVDKSAEDFEETNRNIQEVTYAAISEFSDYIRTIFPLPQVTEEELRSEEFVRKDILYLKDRLTSDLEESKTLADRSIIETKTKIGQMPGQILDGIKAIPKLPMRLLEESNVGNNEEKQYDIVNKTSSFVKINKTISEGFIIHPDPNDD